MPRQNRQGRPSQAPQGTLGGLLRKFRLSKGISIQEMSQKTGYSAGYLGQVENFKHAVNARIRDAYERITGYRIISTTGKKGSLRNDPPRKKR